MTGLAEFELYADLARRSGTSLPNLGSDGSSLDAAINGGMPTATVFPERPPKIWVPNKTSANRMQIPAATAEAGMTGLTAWSIRMLVTFPIFAGGGAFPYNSRSGTGGQNFYVLDSGEIVYICANATDGQVVFVSPSVITPGNWDITADVQVTGGQASVTFSYKQRTDPNPPATHTPASQAFPNGFEAGPVNVLIGSTVDESDFIIEDIEVRRGIGPTARLNFRLMPGDIDGNATSFTPATGDGTVTILRDTSGSTTTILQSGGYAINDDPTDAGKQIVWPTGITIGASDSVTMLCGFIPTLAAVGTTRVFSAVGTPGQVQLTDQGSGSGFVFSVTDDSSNVAVTSPLVPTSPNRVHLLYGELVRGANLSCWLYDRDGLVASDTVPAGTVTGPVTANTVQAGQTVASTFQLFAYGTRLLDGDARDSLIGTMLRQSIPAPPNTPPSDHRYGRISRRLINATEVLL